MKTISAIIITLATSLVAQAAPATKGVKKSAHAAAPAAATNTNICTRLNKAVATGTPTQKLNKYLTEQWNYQMTESPEFASWVGFPGQDDRWSDYSLETISRHNKETVCELDALNKIPAKNLKGEDKVNFDLAKQRLEMSLEGQKFNSEYMPLDHLGGLHITAADLINTISISSKKDYENIIARLEKLPKLAEQTEFLMREGMKRQLTPVKMFLARVPAQFDKLLPQKEEDSPLYRPFVKMTANFSTAEKTELQTKALATLKEKTYPALKKLRDFVITVYIPAARENISISSMPNGKEWYAYEVKRHTTTSMTPDQLHQLGLNEVARLTTAMQTVKEQTNYKGSLSEFNTYLIKDKKFFYDNKESLMLGFRDIAKRIDAELPKIFKTLPRLPYGVNEMSAHKAEESPAAYYLSGSIEGRRAGTFEANTSDLPGRPKWGMEALTLHEAVPGHHLQIALGQEVQDLPEFRKHGQFTAFIEGWGLYAEGLGEDLGLYKDPYSRYGQLSYEMWRAIRLVVDTGIHAKGWTREQAIDYFAQNMPKARKEIEVEVDRYITWPGQALAYKVGQLKFRELRDRAAFALGEKFDVREFHDQALMHGALPLSVLEKNIDDWIALQKKGVKSSKDHLRS